MYESFFGLNREPFSVAPDPRFLYMSDKHREALAHLNNGLRQGGGFVLLTGEIGAGKTTVWRRFLSELPPNFDVAYVVNPKLGVQALLARVCEDLGVDKPADGSAMLDPIDALHGHLLLSHAQDRRTLVVVDEAQALSPDVLEQLRLLTNLVTSDRKLVQVLLIGQPELRELLEHPVLEPVAQRVVARYHLRALTRTETRHYIAHRLAVAGFEGTELPFDAQALQRIHKLCGGVPRRINVLCDRALIAARTAGERKVTRAFVDRAAGQVFGRRGGPFPNAGWPAGAAVAGVIAASVVVGAWLAPTLTKALGKGNAALQAAAQAVENQVAQPAAVPASVPASAAEPAPAVVAVALAASAAAAPVQAAPPPDPAPIPAPAPAPVQDPVDALLRATPVEPPARTLARLWNVELGAGEPCTAAQRQALHCHRSRGGLTPIRQLGRPGLLTLSDPQGRSAQVMLVGLNHDSALLRRGDATQRLPLSTLARSWQGDFATYWRAPPGYHEGIVQAGDPLMPWLAGRLARIDGQPAPADEAALRARVFAFQLANGLEADGLVGPVTLMRINQASGVAEPALEALP